MYLTTSPPSYQSLSPSPMMSQTTTLFESPAHQGLTTMSSSADDSLPDEPLPSYTPQAITDLLPIYDSVQKYTLRQENANTQTLVPQSDEPDAVQYHIKTFASGGFMNKKPHINISSSTSSTRPQRNNDSPLPPPSSTTTTSNRRLSILPRRDVTSTQPPPEQRTASTTTTTTTTTKPHLTAEARFDIGGTGTTITYSQRTPPSNTQRLTLCNSQAQTLRLDLGPNAETHYWQPHAGNRRVLELVNGADEVMARFVPAAPPASDSSSSSSSAAVGKKRASSSTAEMEIGDIYVAVAALAGEGQAVKRLEVEVLCSAVVVVERARRRATIIGGRAKGLERADITRGTWPV